MDDGVVSADTDMTKDSTHGTLCRRPQNHCQHQQIRSVLPWTASLGCSDGKAKTGGPSISYDIDIFSPGYLPSTVRVMANVRDLEYDGGGLDEYWGA